ncbi:MAG: sulfite exporter TauE/SafE family protein [Cyclobacteriaceae bacterium]|nr:sulfite exporter TauE/SafE family protein [Cyclobacteriaceae bacterium]
MLFTAFLLGLAGSLHCLGMCSPLVMAVTSYQRPYFYNRLLYNGGRILMYGLMGMVASSFGSILSLSAYQTWLTISLGILLLLIGVTGSNLLNRIPIITSVMHRISSGAKSMFATLLKEKNTMSYFLLGALNGLLPCGLTYMALTYCFILPGYCSGFLFMIFFGLGTLAVMLGFTSVLKEIMQRFHISLQRFTTVSLIVLGIVLVARGVIIHETPHRSGPEEIVICK